MEIIRSFVILAVAIFTLSIFGSILSVEGAYLDAGDKVYESDLDTLGDQYYHFDSGCMIRTKPSYIQYVPALLDGDISTGLDHDFGSSASAIQVVVEFPYDFFVKNITVDPVFNGQYSKCHLGISTKTTGGYMGYDIITETTF